MEERVWIGVPRDRDLDKECIERPLACHAVDELAKRHRIDRHAHPDRVQIALDLRCRRGPRRLVRRRDREGELLPALVADAVAVVVLPIGRVQ